MSINEIIAQRRSIYPKEFTGEKIEDEIIKILLKNAHWAPSHKNTFPWLFKVLKGESLQRWTEAVGDLYTKQSGEEFKQEKLDKILSYPNQASHVLAICMKRSTQVSIPEMEEVAAVSCAVQNIYLSLSQFDNIGGYWSTGNGTFSEKMKEYFSLSGEDKLMGYFFIGTVKEKRTESHRKSWEGNVEWL